MTEAPEDPRKSRIQNVKQWLTWLALTLWGLVIILAVLYLVIPWQYLWFELSPKWNDVRKRGQLVILKYPNTSERLATVLKTEYVWAYGRPSLRIHFGNPEAPGQGPTGEKTVKPWDDSIALLADRDAWPTNSLPNQGTEPAASEPAIPRKRGER